jgi:hypothetical protein
LLVVAAWTAFVWITLIRNIAKDHAPGHGTAFHLVHYVLAAIALSLDIGVASLGWRGWRAARQKIEHGVPVDDRPATPRSPVR